MKRGGSVLHEYGVSLGDTVGMITATNEAIQNPEKVGNGLKSVAINLAGMKVSADDGTLSLNKTAKGLKEIAGITIYKNKDTGELKNMVQLLDELKGKWGELREDEQKGLAEAIAGKQQAAIFQSLMGNYETFKEIRSEFSQGLQFGSAEAENKQYLDSLAGRLNELKTIWADIFQTVFNSNTTYGFLDCLISVSNGINSVIKTLERLKLTTPALIGSFMTLKTLFSSMGTTNGVMNMARLINPLNMILAPIKGVTTTIQAYKNSLNAMSAGRGLGLNSIERATLGLTTFRTEMARTTFGARALNLATGLLNGAMIGLATFAISKGIQWIDDTIHKYEKLAEKQKEVIGTTTSEISSLQQKKKSLEGISEEYNNLASKTEKTADETARFSELKQQIADIAPELVLGVDENNDPILNMSGNLDEVINKLKKAVEEKNKLLKAQEDELAITTSKTAPDTKKDLDNAKKDFDKVFEDKNNSFKNALSKSSFKEQTEALKKAYNQQETDFAEHHQKLLTEYEKYNAEEEIMQKKAINRLTNSDVSKTYAKQSEQKKSKMNELVANMNWHDYSIGQQNSIISAFDKISESIPVEKLDQWNKKINDANTNFQASGDMNQYTKELQGLANELQKLSGGSISADTWLIGLQQGLYGLDLASMKLHAFLKSYGSSTAELENKDSFAIKLKNQFDALNDFSQDLEVNGKINVKLLEDIQSGEAGQDLPQQLKDIINGFTFGEDSQIEAQAQLALQVTTTLQNEGQLSNDVVKQLNDLFKGKLQLTDDILENGLKISDKLPALPGNMVQALNEQFANAFTGDNAPEITPSVNGEKAKKELKELEQFKKDTFKSDKIVTKINNTGLDFAQKDLSVLKEQLDRFADEDVKLKFISDSAEAFKDVNSLEEAREKISAPMSLKYDIDIDKKGLTEEKKIYDNLDTNLQIKVDNGDIAIEKLHTIKNLIDEYPEQKETIFKSINENPDILAQIEDINNLPDDIKKIFGIEVKGKEDIEKTKENVKDVEGKHDIELLGNVEVQGMEDGKITGWDFENNKPYTFEVKPKVTNKEELDDTRQKMDELNGKTATPTVDVKTEGKEEVEQTAEFIQGISPIKVVELSLNNEGKDELDNTKQKMDELNGEKVEPVVGAIGLEDTASKIASLGQQAEEFGQNNYNINLNAETSQGAKNISGLIARVKQYLALKVSTLVFRTETAQGAKNVSGLLAKVQSYVSRYGGKTIKTTFSALTSTAAKNISGLIRKIESFKSNYAGKTFTTTFVTNKVTNSSGGGGGGNSSDKTNKTERTSVTGGTPIPVNLSAQPRTSEPAPISDETPVTKPSLFSRAVSRAASPIKTLKTLTQDTPIDKNFDAIIKYEIELFKELENQLSKVTNELSLLDKQMKNATNEQKLNYLKKQNELYKEQERLLNRKESLTKDEANRFKKVLSDKGFKFNSDGNMTNYEELAIKKEKELAKLEAEANKEKASDKTKKKYEDAKKAWDETKKYRDEYLDIMFTELPKVVEEKQEIVNATKDMAKAERELKNEAWKLHKESEWTSMNRDVEEVNNQLELLDVLMGSAFGVEKNDLLQQKLDLLEKQKKEMSETTDYMKQSQNEIKGKLQGFGFEFRDDGTITNYIQQLDKLFQSNDNFDEAKELADAYLDLMMDKIPDAEKEMAKLDATIKAALKEKLETTKEIEDEITKVYEKQIEERKKQIDDELKKRLDALNKEKEAYNKARDKADYQRDYDDKSKEIEELQKKLDIAERDSSLSGQKKVQELRKELEEAKRALEDLVQDQIDKDVNDMYDDESDRLQDEADKAKEDLDNKYTKEELARLIKEALNTGLFTDINGEVHDLQQTLLDFADKYGDGLGATGAIIKSELVGNLEIAKKVMEDMLDIQDKLGVGEYSNYSAPKGRSYQPQQSNQNQFNYNAPLVSVQGTMDRNILKEVEKMIKKSQDELAKEIIRKTKY